MHKYLSDVDSYNQTKNMSENMYLSLQIKYKQSFECILKSVVNFKELDLNLSQVAQGTPVVEDFEYNLYRKFSVLDSRYVYLRNNVHIERLSEDELLKVKNCVDNNNFLDVEFLIKTCAKVLFENDNYTFYGIPTMDKLVDSKSLVFEFAYDQTHCESIEQIGKINEVFKNFYQVMKVKFSKTNMPVSMIVYKSIPDIYRTEEDVELDVSNLFK